MMNEEEKSMRTKWFQKAAVLITLSIFLINMTGCAAVKEGKGEELLDSIVEEVEEQTGNEALGDMMDDVVNEYQSGEIEENNIPDGFPNSIPIYHDAVIIDSSQFNGNGYSLLYHVTDTYDNVLNFYADSFDLDLSAAEEGGAYYEGIEYDNILINGLTIEEVDDGINVYITLRDYNQSEDMDVESDDDVYEEGTEDSTTESGVMRYESAEEVSLDSSYPQEIVPIYSNSKIIGSSMVPGTKSGFIDLILPNDAFEDAVDFYADQLGLKEERNSTTVQEAVRFKGTIDNYKVVVYISELKSDGNDPYVQITVNEN